MILTPLQKLNNNLVDLGKIIVAPGFEWLPKVQKITQSGHTALDSQPHLLILRSFQNITCSGLLETRRAFGL